MNERARDSLKAIAVGFFALLPLVFSASCTRREPIEKPNVILITLDALRASRLGCYEYHRNTSPNIDSFAEGATLFSLAFSTSPWTLPTHASIMTGTFPFEHGARTFRLKGKQVREYPLDEAFETLAEALSREGYSTAAFTANTGYLDRRWKLDQGFEVYYNERVGGELINEAALKWLGSRDRRPFFLFLNYMDTHGPYNVRRPARRPEFLADVPEYDQIGLFDKLNKKMLEGTSTLPPEDVRALSDLYDIAIANVDEFVVELFEKFRASGLYESSLIVLTSDHGEYFGEHALIEHGKDVYNGGIQIPLIIKYPHQESGRVHDTQVSAADIPRLIFSGFPHQIARRQIPEFRGDSISPIVVSENYYVFPSFWELMRRERFNRTRSAVIRWPYKLIQSSDGRHELYDLESDPRELSNLAHREPRLVGQLIRSLRTLKQNRGERLEPGDEAAAATPEQLEELEALGYL